MPERLPCGHPTTKLRTTKAGGVCGVCGPGRARPARLKLVRAVRA